MAAPLLPSAAPEGPDVARMLEVDEGGGREMDPRGRGAIQVLRLVIRAD
jgi:hypothetical protein